MLTDVDYQGCGTWQCLWAESRRSWQPGGQSPLRGPQLLLRSELWMAWSLEAPCRPACGFQQEDSSVQRGSRQYPVPANIQEVRELVCICWKWSLLVETFVLMIFSSSMSSWINNFSWSWNNISVKSNKCGKLTLSTKCGNVFTVEGNFIILTSYCGQKCVLDLPLTRNALV